MSPFHKKCLSLNRIVRLLSGFLILSVYTNVYANTSSADMAVMARIDEWWDIFLLGGDGADPIRLTQTLYDESELCWSPDRENLAFSASDGKLYSINVQTRQVIELAADDEAKKKTSPGFSPDGTQIVYVRFKDGPADDSELVIYDLETQTSQKLIDQPGPQFDPAWSPDGRFVVYSNTHCTAECGHIIQELWWVNVADHNARQLLLTNSQCMQPAWSPDGDKIAFVSDKAGNFDIWLLSLTDWSLRQITFDPALDKSPAWSPDGTRIGFVSTRTGAMRIWTKDLNNGKLDDLALATNQDFTCRDIAW